MSAWPQFCAARRQQLRAAVPDGAILLLGSREVPRNYRDNVYPFRQNSTFLYYTGLAEPGLALLLYPDGRQTLFAPAMSTADLVWTGPMPSPEERAAAAGIAGGAAYTELAAAVGALRNEQTLVHCLLPFDPAMRKHLADLLGIPGPGVAGVESLPLKTAVIAQRSIKAAEEIAEIEEALATTNRMHQAVMSLVRPGITEAALAGSLQGIALVEDRAQSYTPIVTVRGEILHNHGYPNTLRAGQLLLNDSGAESPRFYASDITRTLPVSGKFTDQQRAVYETVLRAQLEAIAAIQPGVPYRDIHLQAARTMTAGLIDLGLMQGDPEEAVAAGAHAAFFVHGLGHMLGLDVHDMEDLGEDLVGYAPGQTRSAQFGLAWLRLARPLEAGFVLTVEPGLYFIPTLWDQWQAEGRCADFIRFDQLDAWRDFGGIRIEDDIVVTPTGAQVLGPGIPKTVAEIETLVGVGVG